MCARAYFLPLHQSAAKRPESRSNAEMYGILRRSCGLASLCMKNTSIKKRDVGKSEDVLCTKDLNVDDKQSVFKTCQILLAYFMTEFFRTSKIIFKKRKNTNDKSKNKLFLLFLLLLHITYLTSHYDILHFCNLCSGEKYFTIFSIIWSCFSCKIYFFSKTRLCLYKIFSSGRLTEYADTNETF